MRLSWLWPTIIILSAIAASLVTFIIPDTPLRPIVVMWFLFICPGMALVRFFRLNQPIVEWILALALSFAIDALLAGIQLYTGRWSPTATLEIVIGLSLGGAFMKLRTMHSTTRLLSKQLYTVLLRRQSMLRTLLVQKFLSLSERSILYPLRKGKRVKGVHIFSERIRSYRNYTVNFVELKNFCTRTLRTASLMLLLGISLGTGLWFYVLYQNHGSAPSTGIPPSKVTPHSNSTSMVTSTPIPSSTTSVNGAETYYGSLHDIPTGMTTNISLTIWQQPRNISGYFGRIPENGVFKGISQNSSFTGTINPAKQIQFIVTSDTGQSTFSFDGAILPDGAIAGTYCSFGETTGKCSDYGLWSISPVK